MLAATRQHGNSASVAGEMASFADREQVVGTGDWLALDGRYAE